jgi:hypothetical protein
MADHENRFEVLPVGEMRRKYYRPGELAPEIRLDPVNVPAPLRHLIPVAEKWGISDDMLRIDAVRNANAVEIADLKHLVQEHDDLLDEWLAGSEAESRSPSQEYLAFTHMRMAADGC